jgi:hypothetical protein
LHAFVATEDVAGGQALADAGLPAELRGRPTRHGWDDTHVSHHVVVTTLDAWTRERLGFDPLVEIPLERWLATPQQLLLEATAGPVLNDARGELTRMREALAWYPDDVWRWLVASQWRRMDQEEPFVGRTAEVGDDLGSRILTARLARDAVRLCFLLERRYAPYAKWLGSGFRRLDAYVEVGPPLERALAADAYPEREEALIDALTALARRHNAAGVTAPVSEEPGWFHERPFRVLGSARFVDACLERVTDERLRALPLVGGIDQWVDSTDVLSELRVLEELTAAYRARIAS